VQPSTVSTHRPLRAPAVEQATSLRFASAVRALGGVARSSAWAMPAFRSPPRVPGADRTLRRRVDGGTTVSVRLRERPWPAVLADMIDGVVTVNGLGGTDATGARAALWHAAQTAGLVDRTPAEVAA
jgi:hypothetical protein